MSPQKAASQVRRTGSGGVRTGTVALRRVAGKSFLGQLPAATRDRLLESAELRGLPRPSPLFAAGETSGTVHLLLEGGVELYGTGPQGREVILGVVQPADLVAAWAPLLGRPHAVAGRSTGRTRLLCLPAASLREALGRDASLAEALLRQLCREAEALMTHIADLKLRTTTERVARYLLSRAPSAHGRFESTLPFRKQLIASQLGMTPESLSRAFAALQPIGVSTVGHQVLVADADRLRRFCSIGR